MGCVYVCMYVRVYAYRTHIMTGADAAVSVCVCVFVCVCVCVFEIVMRALYIYMCTMHVCMYVCVCTYECM